MKHFDLTKLNKRGLAKFMVTQTSNSFGDQVLELKEYQSRKEGDVTISGYKVIATQINEEGSWINLREMKSWLKQVKKEN